MKLKKNMAKGFTLVELLAVIVILAIILVIAVPQIMNVIKDTTKASFESSAKMVAAQVENQYTVAQTLSKEFGGTGSCMEDWAGLNDVDYESCTYEIDNEGNAKVTLTGKGKFKNLWVCNGTRSSATATEEKCKENTGVSYITDLLAQESTLNNGLFLDDTDDQNIRYYGESPNNYVYFNCEDTHDGKLYGSNEYDYANACETWRIIGIFDVANTIGGTPEKRIKIVRDAFIGSDGNALKMSWDSSYSPSRGSGAINSGGGINQWGEVKDSNGDIIYEGADLMQMLNGYYIRESESCTYCNNSGSATCSIDCSNDILPISDSSLNMIENSVWSTRAILNQANYPNREMYELERTSTLTGKDCETSDLCNDTVTRTAEWEGKIGLIYPSDWQYASSAENCLINGTVMDCSPNNWLQFDTGYLTLCSSSKSNDAYTLTTNTGNIPAFLKSIVRPATYLKYAVKIVGGNGSSDNAFRLGI